MRSQPAVVMTNQELARSLKRKMAKPVKNTLCTPFKVIWPAIDGATQISILNELKKSFSERNLKNPLTNNLPYRRLKKEERQKRKDEYLAESKQLPEEVNLRSQLVFGVTEISRQLEKGQLRLVVIDRSSPWQLHRHLAQLTAVRGCPALAIDGVSESLSQLVSVTRMCALGFKVKTDGDSNYLDNVVSFVVGKCRPVELPWLDCENDLNAIKQEAKEQLLSQQDEILQNSSDVHEESVSNAVDDDEEDKDYSYLYTKRTQSTTPACNMVSVTAMDDMWGKHKNGETDSCMFGNAGNKISFAVSQVPEKLPSKSENIKKRKYCEPNVKAVERSAKKK